MSTLGGVRGGNREDPPYSIMGAYVEFVANGRDAK